MLSFGCRSKVGALVLLAIFAFQATELIQAADALPATNSSAAAGRMNCGAHIECVTPDGQPGRISRVPAQDPSAAALIMEDDTVTCVLQEGETNFVIELPTVAVPDRFTFLNENGKARGELKISVSNQRLAPNSAEWKEVEGVIPFVHKRLFGVSLLGIEAKYVRLSFRVEKQVSMAATDSAKSKASPTEGERAGRHAVAFTSSALHEALNATVSTETRPSPVLLSCITSSVGPLNLAGR